MIRGRLRRHGKDAGPGKPEPEYVEIDPEDLTAMLAAPRWLRNVGLSAWLLVGFGLLLFGLVWIASITYTIVLPVITAAVIAAVASPMVAALARHRVPRAAGTILLMLALLAVGALVVFVVIAGITSQGDGLRAQLSDAKDTIAGWLQDLGVDPSAAEAAKNDASSGATASVSALLDGLAAGIDRLSSLIFFLALTALSTFFMLKDGPQIRAWGERHLGVPDTAAHGITQRILEALRGYFLGVTVVAIFNGVVVGIGAVLLGVPLAGTIALITFLAAYIPYLGAWSAASFSVLIALGGAGVDAAIGMVVVQLLANGVLQQMVQPLAMGAALGIHPLAVLIVTIAGGALFGAVGLILAAPLTAAVVKISADLARATEEREAAAPPAPAAPAPPAPATG